MNNQLTGELHWVLTDHINSVRIVLDSGGHVVGRRDDLPFGEALRDVNEPGQMGPMSAQTSGPTGLWTWSNSIRTEYAGMEKDVTTGLDQTTVRKYDSGYGRWTSPDPYGGSMSISDPQTLNRYAYVRNDPVNATDPSGLVESDNFCGAQYSFEQCGGMAGITGGYFGSKYADYQENYGWLPAEVVGDYKKYEQRVMNASYGNGFLTNDEVNRAVAENFPTYYGYDANGNLWTDFHLFWDVEGSDAASELAEEMNRYPIGGTFAVLYGGSVLLGATGGAGAYALGSGGSGLTTIGTIGRVAAPAAAGGGAVLDQLSHTDQSIFELAAEYGASATQTFKINLIALTQAVADKIPGGQINVIGRIGDSPIYGSLVSKVGIASVNGQTVIVKVVEGNPKILGPLP